MGRDEGGCEATLVLEVTMELELMLPAVSPSICRSDRATRLSLSAASKEAVSGTKGVQYPGVSSPEHYHHAWEGRVLSRGDDRGYAPA
jgi:hypothetical protein